MVFDSHQTKKGKPRDATDSFTPAKPTEQLGCISNRDEWTGIISYKYLMSWLPTMTEWLMMIVVNTGLVPN